jgi:hypothetical protein
MPLSKKEAIVDELLAKLGLTKCADTIVGDNKVHFFPLL